MALVDDQRGAGLIADCDIPSGQFVIEAIGEVKVIVTATVTWCGILAAHSIRAEWPRWLLVIAGACRC